MDFLAAARALQPQIVEWRRAIHQQPELGFEETQTASLVAQHLNALGLEAQTGVGRTGVVARIEGSASGSGRRVGIRADMDALPIQEANDVPYASQVPGKMHACGHDAHTAMLLGVATLFAQSETPPPGEIRFLFQPSEEGAGPEGISGATAMLDDGALEGLDAVIALHVSSENDAGTLRVGSGYMMAAVDSFNARIIGRGCHGASPHSGLDPFWMLAQVINAIQAIRSRRLNPTAPSVISLGAVHAGSAHNVIPNEVDLNGTIRSFDEEIRASLHEQLEQALAITRAFGGDYELEILSGYPATYNDPAVAETARAVAEKTVGAENLRPAHPIMGAEDFSYMTQKAPGAMIFLGARYDDQTRPHHSPIFNINEDCLHLGSAFLAETAWRLLQEG